MGLVALPVIVHEPDLEASAKLKGECVGEAEEMDFVARSGSSTLAHDMFPKRFLFAMLIPYSEQHNCSSGSSENNLSIPNYVIISLFKSLTTIYLAIPIHPHRNHLI